MTGLLIAVLLSQVVVIVTVIMSEIKMEQFVGEALCELMTAVFNEETIKAQAKKAAEEGKGYIEL